MNLPINEEFKSICRKILLQNKKDLEWAEIESDDEFQTQNFTGGYDATEMAFTFSYYDNSRKEYWFQVTLEEVEKILNDDIKELVLTSIEDLEEKDMQVLD